MASSGDEDDADCSASEQPPSTAEILMRALDIMRRGVASESVRESTSVQFFAFQASLVLDFAKKAQKDIRDFSPCK
ncbi:hypothetical protein MTO96_046814 [Rhipicephalus appendiculatus]